MNKKLLLASLVSGVLLATISFKHSFKVSLGDNTITFDVDAIQALSHKDGETVNFVNDYISSYWAASSTDFDLLKSLYEMNTDIESFYKTYNKDDIRELYANWDDFKPTNNVLTWKSNVRANSYDIVVSLDAELTKAVQEEKGLTKEEFTIINPYSKTHYFWQVTAHTDSGDVKSTIFDFYSGDYKRTVDIPDVSNTRDVGGFQGDYGYMKEGLIYRSGRLDEATQYSKDALASLGVQTDLDLRSKGEGLTNPAGLENYYLKTMLSYGKDFEEANRQKTVEAVRVFADPNNYPVIFHCAVGRDRTGTLAMILQALAGASKEYIIHDYYTSMWSVTGAYQKSIETLNYNGVLTILNNLTKNDTYSLSEGAEIFLKERKDTISGEMVGLTDAEIKAIRDIWSGKIEVNHLPQTFAASENYEGKAFVKIEAIGHEDSCYMVNKGTVIAAPYELKENYMWYSNNEIFDFATAINETTFIYADYALEYAITIHFVGANRQDEIVKALYGQTITLTEYELDGYDMIAISDTGNEISKLKVTRDAYINVIYTRK